MLREFRNFILSGNVLAMAVGIIIGIAFGKVVTSFVTDVLMPPIGLAIGNVDFANLFYTLSGPRAATLQAAKAAGATTINYGVFINTVIDFILVAFVIFLIARRMPASTKECPHCSSMIPLKARRCPNCTTQLQPA